MKVLKLETANLIHKNRDWIENFGTTRLCFLDVEVQEIIDAPAATAARIEKNLRSAVYNHCALTVRDLSRILDNTRYNFA